MSYAPHSFDFLHTYQLLLFLVHQVSEWPFCVPMMVSLGLGQPIRGVESWSEVARSFLRTPKQAITREDVRRTTNIQLADGGWA